MSNYLFQLNLSDAKKYKLTHTAEVYTAMFEYTLKKQLNYYKENKTFLVDSIIRKEFTQLKKEPRYQEVRKINSEIIHHAIHSATKYFIHCIKNDKIPKSSKEPIKGLHFFTNAKRVKIDFKKNIIHIDKIKNLKFLDDKRYEMLKDKELELKGCKVYFDKEMKNWVTSIDIMLKDTNNA